MTCYFTIAREEFLAGWPVRAAVLRDQLCRVKHPVQRATGPTVMALRSGLHRTCLRCRSQKPSVFGCRSVDGNSRRFDLLDCLLGDVEGE
jgi:hypothetical protein